MSRGDHWDRVYTTKAPDEVSWFQPSAAPSLELLEAIGVDPDGGLIDVGGGASTLVAELLDRGFGSLAVLDVSRAAIEAMRARLGARAASVQWFEADVTSFEPPRRWAVWHDRALFHFLTEPADRAAYRAVLGRALEDGGHVIVATFDLDGPERCSGLEVVRYSAESLSAELGADYRLIRQHRDLHRTPGGKEQAFVYSVLRREG